MQHCTRNTLYCTFMMHLQMYSACAWVGMHKYIWVYIWTDIKYWPVYRVEFVEVPVFKKIIDSDFLCSVVILYLCGANTSIILCAHMHTETPPYINLDTQIKIFFIVSLLFVMFYLSVDSLQKRFQRMKVLCRNLNWINRDSLFQRGYEEV